MAELQSSRPSAPRYLAHAVPHGRRRAPGVGTERGCPCPQCCRPPRPRAQLPSPLPGRILVMKSLAPPGSLLVPSAARPGRWLCRGRADRGRRPPRFLPRPFPGCSGAAAHRLLPGREQTKEEKLPPCAVAWEHGAALAAACRRCPRPHKAALLGEEQNLCPAPSRQVCAATRLSARQHAHPCPRHAHPCMHHTYPCPARSVPTPARTVPTPACTTPPPALPGPNPLLPVPTCSQVPQNPCPTRGAAGVSGGLRRAAGWAVPASRAERFPSTACRRQPSGRVRPGVPGQGGGSRPGAGGAVWGCGCRERPLARSLAVAMGTGAGSGALTGRRVRGSRPGSERGPQGSRWAPSGLSALYHNSCTSSEEHVKPHTLCV